MYSICSLSTDAALTCTICRRISAVGDYISVVGHIYYTTFISYSRCFTWQLAPIHKLQSPHPPVFQKRCCWVLSICLATVAVLERNRFCAVSTSATFPTQMGVTWDGLWAFQGVTTTSLGFSDSLKAFRLFCWCVQVCQLCGSRWVRSWQDFMRLYVVYVCRNIFSLSDISKSFCVSSLPKHCLFHS